MGQGWCRFGLGWDGRGPVTWKGPPHLHLQPSWVLLGPVPSQHAPDEAQRALDLSARPLPRADVRRPPHPTPAPRHRDPGFQEGLHTEHIKLQKCLFFEEGLPTRLIANHITEQQAWVPIAGSGHEFFKLGGRGSPDEAQHVLDLGVRPPPRAGAPRHPHPTTVPRHREPGSEEGASERGCTCCLQITSQNSLSPHLIQAMSSTQSGAGGRA